MNKTINDFMNNQCVFTELYRMTLYHYAILKSKNLIKKMKFYQERHKILKRLNSEILQPPTCMRWYYNTLWFINKIGYNSPHINNIIINDAKFDDKMQDHIFTIQANIPLSIREDNSLNEFITIIFNMHDEKALKNTIAVTYYKNFLTDQQVVMHKIYNPDSFANIAKNEWISSIDYIARLTCALICDEAYKAAKYALSSKWKLIVQDNDINTCIELQNKI